MSNIITNLCDRNSKERVWIWRRGWYLSTVQKYNCLSFVKLCPDGVVRLRAYVL